jgi:hypothetical protein
MSYVVEIAGEKLNFNTVKNHGGYQLALVVQCVETFLLQVRIPVNPIFLATL